MSGSVLARTLDFSCSRLRLSVELMRIWRRTKLATSAAVAARNHRGVSMLSSTSPAMVMLVRLMSPVTMLGTQDIEIAGEMIIATTA
ncbi:unannotated protein [freshwater metagenome]|uniref:Unannotated protein n=1 Tax=freshwater metagenome TaxID=449393 RepID=A0A6J6U4P3_9ZZZZ